MPNVGWKSLEGKPWKLDVGSTMQEALQSKDNSTLHFTTDGQIVMNGVAFCNSSYYPTKISEPDFKVHVRKALPMYPRKGMKYYFDNGVKYNLPKKMAFDNGFTFTVPDDGNTWVVCGFKGDKSDKVIPNGTVIDKTNLLEFFPGLNYNEKGYTVITKKVGKPVIVIVQKDGESVFSKDAIYERPLFGDESFNCLDKYRKIVKGKLVYDIPLPDLRKGDNIPSSGYATFKYRLKHLKYYGKDLPNGTSIDGEYYVLTPGGKRKNAYRMLRSYRNGTVYIARAIQSKRRGCGKERRRRFILSPKVKYYVDRSGKIKKRL